MKQYDIIVIGGGAAGLTAAYTAKGFGKRVLLVERDKPGGECTWSGCIPSKALIHIAQKHHCARQLGIDYSIDRAQVLTQIRDVIQTVYQHEDIPHLQEDGIDVLIGPAKFLDRNHIDVNQETIAGKRIIICSGSKPAIPQIPGLNDVPFLTNETLFSQETLPDALAIIGGGPIGVEIGQALNRLGIHIDLFVRGETVVSKEEPEMREMLTGILKSEGIQIHPNTQITHIDRHMNGVQLTAMTPEGERSFVSGNVLVAAGRTPDLDPLGLDAVGVEYTNKGLTVNQRMETSAKGIYAAGDCVGPYRLSHMANRQAIVAVQSAVLPIGKKIDYTYVPWCTFTDPELAHSGLTEAQARTRYDDRIRIYTYDYAHLDRAITHPGSQGLVKIITSRSGKILGTSILGDRAGELISELQLAMQSGIKLPSFASVIHPYPTYAEVLGKLGKQALVDRLTNLPIIRHFR